MNYKIKYVENKNQKSEFTNKVLRELPDWFGIEKSIVEYVEQAADLPFWAAITDINECIGIFSGKIHYGSTGDIFVCAVSPQFNRIGVGSELYKEMEYYFKANKCNYVIVKTLSDIVDYEPYNKTRKFYSKHGFTKLLTLTEMWDENNPCLIMIKDIRE